MDVGDQFKRAFEVALRDIGISVEVLDSQAVSSGTFRAVKGQVGGQEYYKFRHEDQVALEADGQIRKVASGDVDYIERVDSEVYGDVVVCRKAIIKRAPPATKQVLSFANNQIGQVNVAGRDLQVSGQNTAVFGEDVREFLQQMKRKVKDCDELDDETKADAVYDIDSLERELSKRKPRAERILETLGHIASIAAVAQMAHRLGEALALAGIR